MAQLIQSGQTAKPTSGSFRIDFPKAYTKPPNVVVTPFWKDSTGPVGHVETITAVSTTGFTVTSGNYRAIGSSMPYYVNWIAIGE